jgi:hypothetical protein
MWTHEYTADSALPAEAIWAVLADVDELGQAITEDFPDAMAALLAHAAS